MMDTECALAAQGRTCASGPTGFRRLTPGMLTVDRIAEGFGGLPEGIAPGQLLAALKAVAPRLGISVRLVHTLDWLFRFTQPQDWSSGSRPVVWPSASLQQEALGLSVTQAKAINRALIERGLITMKDSPNGKRYGCRDRQGRIVEAYGFDLSPLSARYAEFVRLAAEARAERADMGHLRRRTTIALRGIKQLLETAREFGHWSEEWAVLEHEATTLVAVLKRSGDLGEMAFGVAGLERRQKTVRERLERCLAEQAESGPEGVDSDPNQAEYRLHHNNYKLVPHPEKDTVMANEGGRQALADLKVSTPTSSGGERAGQGTETSRPVQAVPDDDPVLRLQSSEVARLAPKLRPYLTTAFPGWREIVDAAAWLGRDLGVSKALWGEACVTMGREQAAIALAIVSAKPDGHFRSSAGGYFHGMVIKAKAGQLNLDRSIWKLRANGQAGERKSSRSIRTSC